MLPLVRSESKVALALFGVLVVSAVGMLVLPGADFGAEQHQFPASTGPVTVTVSGSPPSSVAVAANYPVELSAGQIAQLGGPMLQIGAQGIGPGGSITLRAFPPGESKSRTVDIPGGVLLVQGDPAQRLTVTVTTPTGTPLQAGKEVARVGIDAQAGTIDLVVHQSAKNYLHLTFARFWTVEYDDQGDAIDVALVNPLATVEGKLGNKDVVPPGLSPQWLHFRWDPGAVTLDLLRTGVANLDATVPGHTVIPTDSVAGDPLGSGLVVRANGAEALTLQLGSAQPDVVRATIGGDAMDSALGGPLVLSLHHYGLLPWDALLVVYSGNGVSGTASYLQPATLKPVFEAATHPDRTTVAIPGFDRNVILPGGSAGIRVNDQSDAVQVVQGGSTLLTAEAVPGGPLGTTPDIVLSGSLLQQMGLASPTHVAPNYLAGLILGTSGDGQDAVSAVLTDLAGNIVAQAEQGDGAYLRVGAEKVAVAEGRIVATHQPALPHHATITLYDGAGATAATVTGSDLTTGPGAPADAQPVLTATVAGQTVTLASPIELHGPMGAWTGFRVLNPVNSSEALVAYDGDGLFVLGQKVAPPEPSITGAGDPLSADTFDIGAGPATVHVDRTTAPPTITVTGVQPPQVPQGPETPTPPQTPGAPDVTTIQVPIVVIGPPTAPTGIVVYDPQHMPAPPPLLSVQDLPTGTSVVTLPSGEVVELPSNLVQSEGLPLSSPQWRLTLRPPGQAPIVVPVDRAAAQAALYGNGVDLTPFVTVLGSLGPKVDFYKIASDGPRTLDPDHLDGQGWLNGHGDIAVRVDVPKQSDLYQPVLLWANGALPQRGASPSASMQRVGGNANFTSYRAAIPAAWLGAQASGATVHFALGFDANVVNLGSQSFADNGDGAGYMFKVDHDGPTSAGIVVSTPAATQPTQLRVTWTARDAGSGVASYLVQKARDDAPWEDWVAAASGTAADFTGVAGHTYSFRVRATDRVGNAGSFSPVATAAIPAPPSSGQGNNSGGGDSEQGAVNHAPTIHLLAPLGGEVFQTTRTIPIRWTAADPDGTTPVVTLWGSGDGGSNWAIIASPEGSEYTWDVSRLSGSDFRVKASASDGTLQDADTSARFTIDNAALITEESLGGPDRQQGLPDNPATGGGNPPGSEGAGAAGLPSTMLWMALGGALAAVGALVAVWKLGWIGRR